MSRWPALVVGAGLGTLAGCAERATRYPPPPPRYAPRVSASARPPASASATPSPLPAPVPPPPVDLVWGEPIRFKRGPAVRVVPVLRESRPLALSPDGRTAVLLDGNVVHVLGPGRPAGYPLDGAASTRALFTSDGGRLALYDSAVTAVATTSGDELFAMQGVLPCELRWASPDSLVWHEEAQSANDWKGTLWKADLSTNKAERIGPFRWAQGCHATRDGASWLVTTPDGLVLVDARSGAERMLAKGSDANVVVSPMADRWCTVGGDADGKLSCTRVADGGSEAVKEALPYPELRFDPTGARALLSFSVEVRGEVKRKWALVDFQGRSVREIVGFEHRSGSMPVLLPEGRVLTMGSRSGMSFFDLERGQLRFASHGSLYAAYPMLGHPRVLLAGAEDDSGSSENVYRIEVP